MSDNTDNTLIRKWRKRVDLAKQCAHNEQLLSAIYHYKKAKRIALRLFNEWRHPEQAISALLMSYQALAGFYHQQQETSMARKELSEAHDILLLSLKHREPDYSHKHVLLRGVNESYSMLLKHISRRGQSITLGPLVSI